MNVLNHFISVECNCEYCKMRRHKGLYDDKYSHNQMGNVMDKPNIPTILNTGPQTPQEALNRPIPRFIDQ